MGCDVNFLWKLVEESETGVCEWEEKDSAQKRLRRRDLIVGQRVSLKVPVWNRIGTFTDARRGVDGIWPIQFSLQRVDSGFWGGFWDLPL